MEELAARKASNDGGAAAFRLSNMLYHENQRRTEIIITIYMGNKRTVGVITLQFRPNPNAKG